MDEKQKNILKIIIVVVCLLGAVAIAVWARPEDKGIGSLDKNATVWVKCIRCGAEYQMNKVEYYQQYQEQGAKIGAVPALTCQECGEKGIYKAVKCPECEIVFIEGAARSDYPDRCPDCGYSKTEEMRNKD